MAKHHESHDSRGTRRSTVEHVWRTAAMPKRIALMTDSCTTGNTPATVPLPQSQHSARDVSL